MNYACWCFYDAIIRQHFFRFTSGKQLRRH